MQKVFCQLIPNLFFTCKWITAEKKGQIVSQVKKSISTESVSNTTSHEFDDIPENVNFNCENPLVVNDAAVPAIECSVNSGPNGSLRGSNTLYV